MSTSPELRQVRDSSCRVDQSACRWSWRAAVLVALTTACLPVITVAQGTDSVLWSEAVNLGVRSIVRSGNNVYIGGDFTLVGPNSGGGAPLSVGTGTPTAATPRIEGTVSAVAPDGAGGWFIGGDFTAVGGVPRSNLARVFADGTVSTWSPSANGHVFALAVSGQTLYVGGGFTNIGGQALNGIAALDFSTGAATAWNPSANSFVSALVVAGPTLYAGGGFTSIGGQSRNGLAALSTATGSASAWNPNANGQVLALAVSGSTVYAGGGFTNIGGQARNFVAAIDSVTGNASLWNANADAQVSALAVAGPTVYAGGAFGTIGGQTRSGIAALNSTTGSASAWNPSADAQVLGLAVGGTTVYACGSFQSIGGQSRNKIAAIDAATGTATAWNPRVIDQGGAGRVFALALSGSTIYVGGSFTSIGLHARNHLAVIDATTGALTDVDPNPDGDISALLANGPTVYVAGGFNHIGGQPRTGIAALDASTGAATAWNANSDGGVGAIALGGSAIYVSGGFANIGGQPRDRFAALDLTTASATSFTMSIYSLDPFNPSATISALAVGGPVLYVCGRFDGLSGQPRKDIGAVDAVTGDATPWNPAPAANGQSFVVSALAVDGPTVYAGGLFNNIGGLPHNSLAALLPETGAATFWDPDPKNPSSGFSTVGVITVSGSTVYVGGSFTSIGGQPRIGIAALDPATGAATAWNPNSLGILGARALAVSGQTVYVDGPPGIVAITASGTVDVPNPTPLPPPAGMSLTSAPNPARIRATLRFTLPAAGPVHLALFDPAGRQVATLLDDPSIPAGPHEVSLPTAALTPGLYFARLESGSLRAIHKLLVVE
jgi:hypothetical protein